MWHMYIHFGNTSKEFYFQNFSPYANLYFCGGFFKEISQNDRRRKRGILNTVGYDINIVFKSNFIGNTKKWINKIIC